MDAQEKARCIEKIRKYLRLAKSNNTKGAQCAPHGPDATDARRACFDAKAAQHRDRAEQAQREAREAALWRALGEAMQLGRAVVAIDSTVVGGLDPADHLKQLLERT